VATKSTLSIAMSLQKLLPIVAMKAISGCVPWYRLMSTSPSFHTLP